MSIYDNGSGIQTASSLRNQNDLYPVVSAARNHIAGIGFFTSVGESGQADTNNGWDDAVTYLRNLPGPKRSLNFIAILDSVTANESAAVTCFAQSNNPVVYVYNGGYSDTNGTIGDDQWMDSSNWVAVGSSSNGTIDVTIGGVNAASGLSAIDFTDQDYRTSVSYSNNSVQYTLPQEIAISGSGSISFGEFATDIINSTNSATTGSKVTSAGVIRAKNSANGETFIDGGDITSVDAALVTLTASTSATVGNSIIQPNVITTPNVNSPYIYNVNNIVAESGEGLSFGIADQINGNAIKLGYGPTLNPSALTAETGSGTKAYIETNAEIRIHNLLDASAPTSTSVLVLNASGDVRKVPFSSVAGGANEYSAGFGLTLTGEQFDVDTAVIMTLNTNQTAVSAKRIGKVTITSNTGNELDELKGLVIENNAIDYYANYQHQQHKLLMRVSDGSDIGVVREGPTLYELLAGNVTAGADIQISPAGTGVAVGVLPVHLRKDENDESLYRVQLSRASIKLFTHGEIDFQSNITNPDLSTPGLADLKSELETSPTVLEWVREGGDFFATQTSEQLRRKTGAIMKAGFTATSSPYTTQGLNSTRFRFSAKTPGVDELTTQSEELGGSYSFDVLTGQIVPYDSSNNDFAIQIGMGSANEIGNLYNQVLIPNLVAGSLASDGPNYLGGGGTLQGNWNITGDVTIGGDLTISGVTVGGSSVDFAGTLLALGTPQTGYSGNTSDTADIGFAGLFDWTDTDADGSLDNGEGFITAFFRDGSSSADPKVFAQNDQSSSTTANKPYKLMTSISPAAAPTITLLQEEDQKVAFTPLQAGGLNLFGWDWTDQQMAVHTLDSGHVNRITTDIAAAYTYEVGVADLYHKWDHTSIPTTKAVKEYVDTAISTLTGGQFSADVTTVFSYGITTGELNSATDYTAADADHILVTDDAGNSAKYISPADLGLAIDFDADTASRPTIGYMPGSVVLNEGTSLRAILKKILKAYEVPSINMDSNNEIQYFAPAEDRHVSSNSAYFETGVNTFGDQGANTIEVQVNNYLNATGTTVSTTFSNITVSDVTDPANPAAMSAASSITLAETNTDLVTATNISGSNIIYSIDLDADSGSNDLNGIGQSPVKFDVNTGNAEGSISFKANVTGFTDSNYGTGASSTKTHYVRRRTFYFVSDFNVRSWLGSQNTHTLDSTVGSHYGSLDGDLQSTATTDGHSNKLMHYLLSAMGAGGASQLGAGDVVQNSSGADLTLSAFNLLASDASGNAPNSPTSILKARHMVDAGQSNSGLVDNSNFIPYDSTDTTTIQQIKGALAKKDYIVGHVAGETGVSTTQQWLKNVLSTSPNGFIYRAIPIEFAGTGQLTDWYNNGHLWREWTGTGFLENLVLNNAGTAPATFETTNKYGHRQVYVLFQSDQVGAAGASGSYYNLYKVT